MIYIALAAAVCVAIWEAIQLVKTRRQLAAERAELAQVSDQLAQAHNMTELFSATYSPETIEDFRLIAAALKNGAELQHIDVESIGGTD